MRQGVNLVNIMIQYHWKGNVISVCLNKRGQCFLTFIGNQGHKHHGFADTL